MSNKFNINGSLTTTGNITIQGDLNVKGTTRTVNQETLTIKDNLIAINSDETSLGTVDKTGIIAITGANQYVLNGNYMIDGQALFDMADITTKYNEDVTWQDYFGPYETVANNLDVITRFNSLNLWPTDIIILNDPYGNVPDIGEIFDALSLQIGSGYPGMNLMFGYVNTATGHMMPGSLASIVMSSNKDGTFGGFDVGPAAVVKFENQIISGDDIDFVCQFLKHEDGTPLTLADLEGKGLELKGKAYAAPIYDTKDDTLKIGLGSYEKDEKGNITNFEFGYNQSQSIATRDDSIDDNNLIKWNANRHLLVDSGIDADELIDKVTRATSLNIENGQGLDSIIQTYSGEVDDTHYGNANTGDSAVVFGEANNNSAKRALVFGKMNNNSAANSLLGGLKNTATGYHNTVFGESNIVGGASSLVVGLNNELNGYRSLLVGDGNKAKNGNHNQYIFGKENTANADYEFLAGVGLESSTSNQTVFGKYNTDAPNALFVIGAGTTPENRKNILEAEHYTVKVNGDIEAKNNLLIDGTSTFKNALYVKASNDKSINTFYVNQYGAYDLGGKLSNASYVKNGSAEGSLVVAHKGNANGNKADGIGSLAGGSHPTSWQADGANTVVSGANSIAWGFKTNVTADYSYGLGYGIKISSFTAVINGEEKIQTPRKLAFGIYNEDKHDNMFEIGAGNSDIDRKNIFEVTKDGIVKFDKLTDGTTTKTVAELLADDEIVYATTAEIKSIIFGG